MRWLIMPDSFKGTFTSEDIGLSMERVIKRYDHDAMCTRIVMADGGEGTLDAFKHHVGGHRITRYVTGPHFHQVQSSYLISDDQQTAIIEMAQAAGYELAYPDLNPYMTTTYGVGELMIDAMHHGVKHMIIACGGSATNDGGAGMLAACGMRFLDENNEAFIPTGGTLYRIHAIDSKKLDPLLNDIDMTILTDVDSPLTGPHGASMVFSIQKGATLEDAYRLDHNMMHYASMMEKVIHKTYKNEPGTGAAGGLAYGLIMGFNATIKPGIDVLWDMHDLSSTIKSYDVVITGEGKLDHQTTKGKAIMGILRHVNKQIPVVAICGQIAGDITSLKQQGLTEAIAIYPSHDAFIQRKNDPKDDFETVFEAWVKQKIRGV